MNMQNHRAALCNQFSESMGVGGWGLHCIMNYTYSLVASVSWESSGGCVTPRPWRLSCLVSFTASTTCTVALSGLTTCSIFKNQFLVSSQFRTSNVCMLRTSLA